MIKRVPVDKLKPEMFVSDLNCDWIPHHQLQKQGRIPDYKTIQEISRRGIKEVYIDTERGIDTDDSETITEVEQQNQQKLDKAAELSMESAGTVTVEEELRRATQYITKPKILWLTCSVISKSANRLK